MSTYFIKQLSSLIKRSPPDIAKPLRRMRESMLQAVKREKRKSYIVARFGGKCQRCGESFHPSVYDFHHRDPAKKSFNIDKSTILNAWKSIEEELAKCNMLCANCHRIAHATCDLRFFDEDAILEVRSQPYTL